MRRIGRDMLDAQLLKRSPDLGQLRAVDRAASFGRVKIVSAPVRVEAHRQAMLAKNLA